MKNLKLLIPLLLLLACGPDKDSETQAQHIELNSMIDSLLFETDLLQDSIRKLHQSWDDSGNRWFNKFEMQNLQAKGLKLSEDEIIKDLYNFKEIIPHQGILGGTTYFEQIELVGDRYAITTFSDGHFMGYGIFQYSVKDSTHLIWKHIHSYVDGE